MKLPTISAGVDRPSPASNKHRGIWPCDPPTTGCAAVVWATCKDGPGIGCEVADVATRMEASNAAVGLASNACSTHGGLTEINVGFYDDCPT